MFTYFRIVGLACSAVPKLRGTGGPSQHREVGCLQSTTVRGTAGHRPWMPGGVARMLGMGRRLSAAFSSHALISYSTVILRHSL